MKKHLFQACWLACALFMWAHLTTAFSAPAIVLLQLTGTIGPASQDYIQRGLAEAHSQKANLVILRIDTSGGLETAMRGINEAILASTIPIVTYVAPAGARAASAGTFVLYASPIAAMAPGTHLGPASPVSLVGLPGANEEKNPKKLSVEQKKSMNDAVAYIRSLAELRHRNATWAELAVRQAVSLPAADALKIKVINLIATSIPDLLKQLNGKAVTLQKTPQVLQTTNATINTIKPNWRFRLLSIITHPTIAYILLLVGVYGLFFEFANPGFILPGLLGTIALLIALYAFQLLPINYAGLALLLIGIACIITEVLITSFGIIGISGIVAFIVGSIFLFDSHSPSYHIASSAIIIMCGISVIFFFVVFSLTIGSLRRPIVTGREALIGMAGEVLENRGHYLLVRVQGEIWSAQCSLKLHAGQKIRVKKISNLILIVEPNLGE